MPSTSVKLCFVPVTIMLCITNEKCAWRVKCEHRKRVVSGVPLFQTDAWDRRKEAMAIRVRRQGKRSRSCVAERNKKYGTFYYHSAMILLSSFKMIEGQCS